MLATLRAATLIENSFFRRDVENNTSPYAQYQAMYLADLERLGEDPGVATGTRRIRVGEGHPGGRGSAREAAAVNVQVIVRGEHEAAALVDRLAQRLEDGTPALMGLVDTMLEIESDRFAGRGQRWRKLDPETRRIDRQQGRDPRPNVNKGA
jgi:hypothetical protein